MREKLKDIKGRRIKVTATVSRFGLKKAYRGLPIVTVCLESLKDENGTLLCDHLWMTVGKQMKELNLSDGDLITFLARVTSYQKGYKGYRDDVYKPIETDYRLSNPTKFVRLGNIETDLTLGF